MFQTAEQFFLQGFQEKKNNVYDNILRKQSLKVLETAESWVFYGLNESGRWLFRWQYDVRIKL